MVRIGPSFSQELTLAGLFGLPFSWGADGSFQFDPRMTQAQIDAVQAVYAAHDPAKPAPPVVTLQDQVVALQATVAALSAKTGVAMVAPVADV